MTINAPPIDRAFTAARDTAIRHILERQAAGERITREELTFIDRHAPAAKRAEDQDEAMPISKVASRLGITDEAIRQWTRNKDRPLPTYGRPFKVRYVEVRAYAERYSPNLRLKADERPEVATLPRDNSAAGSVPNSLLPESRQNGTVYPTPGVGEPHSSGNGHGEILKRVADAIKSKRDMTPADAQAIVAIEREQRQAKNDAQRREDLYTRDDMLAAIREIAEAFAKAVDDYATEYAGDLLRTLGAQYAADVAATYPRAAMELEDHYRDHANKLIERVRQAAADAGRKGNHVERNSEAGAAEVLQIHNLRPVDEYVI